MVCISFDNKESSGNNEYAFIKWPIDFNFRLANLFLLKKKRQLYSLKTLKTF